MVDVDKAVIAKYKKGNKEFEIFVDCDAALALRQGKAVDIPSMVASKEVFKNIKQGERASPADLKDAFGTEDFYEVVKKIVKEGQVQVTAAHLDAEREVKKKKLINMIHRNAIDPKTGAPHPPQRIEAAMKEAKVGISDHKSAEEQMEDIVAKLRPIIPIRFEVRELEIIIPPQFANQCFRILKQFKLKEDKWLDNGSLRAVVEIPAGLQEEFFVQLNKICHGEIESKVLNTKGWG